MNSHICWLPTRHGLWNFRRGVIAAMLNVDYRVTIVSPEDESVPKIRSAVRFYPS